MNLHDLKKRPLISHIAKLPIVSDLVRWTGMGKMTAERLLKDHNFRTRIIAYKMNSLNGPIPPKSSPSIIRMVMLREADGKFDWLEYANDDPEIELITMPRNICNPIFKELLSDYLASPTRYMVDNLGEFFKPEYAADRRRWRAVCIKVVQELVDTYQVDLFILPKIHDDWIIDLNLAIKEIGVPALITERENVATPMRMKNVPPTVKKYIDFSVDRLCVASKQHEEFWLKSGHDPDKIVLTGALKSDFWYRQDLWKAPEDLHPALGNNRLKILFFAFGKDTYRYSFWYPGESRDWLPLLWDVHGSLARLLDKYSEQIQLIYKKGAKPGRDTADEAFTLIEERMPGLTAENLLILYKLYRAEQLIVNADLVIGFQSSAIIESMFVDVPIIYVGWGELYDDIKDTMLPLHDTENSGILHARSPAELDQLLDEFVANPATLQPSAEMMQARKSFREFYFSCVDGKVGKRVLDEARALVHEYRDEQGSVYRRHNGH